MNEQELWQECIKFHGHECGGLNIGYKAALYAKELLDLDFSEDEEVVCVSECDACSVDAIQVALGCSVGKGNLLFHMTGKFAFSFYNRKTGKSVRLVLKVHDKGMTHEESTKMYKACPKEDMFDVKETKIEVPESARMLGDIVCDGCGETTADAYIRIYKGKYLCPDCYPAYSRFNV